MSTANCWRKNEVTLQMLVVVRCYEPRFSIHACAAMSHVDSKDFCRPRTYEPRFSVHACAAMSHIDQNIATLNRKLYTGFAGTLGMFTDSCALFAFATALRGRHFALAWHV